MSDTLKDGLTGILSVSSVSVMRRAAANLFEMSDDYY